MTQPILTPDAKPASSIAAHTARINAYANFASRDINSILNEELSAFSSEEAIVILDVGCGNGKQSRYLSKMFPNAKIIAVDISQEAINQLKENDGNLQAFVCDLNNLVAFQSIINDYGPVFDVIISFYALYYIRDIELVLPMLKKALKSGGKLILTGFSKHNNKELLAITGKYAKESMDTGDFIPHWIIEKYFGNNIFKSYYFHNPLRFPSVKSFLEYYRNYGLYQKKTETSVIEDVQKEIIRSGSFTISKVSLVLSIDGQNKNHDMMALPPPLKNDVFYSGRYTELLKQALESGFEIHPICELQTHVLNKPGKVLLLRHDVDLTPYYACKMAEVEARMGIKSTYYFLISGGYFNVLEKECRRCLADISSMGHEIGLHFDDPITIEQDCDILYALVGKRVLSISQHNPTINSLKSIENANLINAYDKAILDKHGFVYVSDSGMKWRRKDIFDFLDCQRLYFLAHPETWFSEGCDLIQLHRKIELHEINKIKKVYNDYVDGNIEYLKKRMTTD